MLRFLIETRTRDRCSGAEYTRYVTIDAEVPALQQQLMAGGFGEGEYEVNQLVGVESLPTGATP